MDTDIQGRFVFGGLCLHLDKLAYFCISVFLLMKWEHASDLCLWLTEGKVILWLIVSGHNSSCLSSSVCDKTELHCGNMLQEAAHLRSARKRGGNSYGGRIALWAETEEKGREERRSLENIEWTILVQEIKQRLWRHHWQEEWAGYMAIIKFFWLVIFLVRIQCQADFFWQV